MAERGGRRRHTWGAPMSWREMRVLEVARAVTAARSGVLSRADWLLQVGETMLRQAVSDESLPRHLVQRAADALAGLQAERAELAANPPRVGRRPEIG
jgi:hypothetical protein